LDSSHKRIHNRSVERIILSSLIFQPEFIEDYSSEVQPDDFYIPFYRDIYRIILKLENGNKIVSENMIKDELEKEDKFNEEEFFNIFLEHPVTKLEFYVKELKNKSTKRKLLQMAKEVEDGIFEQDLDSQELLNYAEEEIFAIGQESSTGGFKNIDEILEETELYIQTAKERDDKTVTGVDTGFSALNKQLTGFNEGDLIILAARPAMGKTALALNFVYHSLQSGNGVAFFSLEMPVEQLMLRLLSIDAIVPLQNLRTGYLDDDENERLHLSLQYFKDKKLFVDDDGNVNIHQLKTKLRKLKAKNPELSLAVVDYIQIMSSSNSQERHLAVSDISRGLKLLAKELKIPIVALSQLNRSLETRSDKRPIMSDIRESGALEQDADIILFVYRDDVYRMRAEKEREKEARQKGEKYEPQIEDKSEEVAEIIIGKQRNGPTGVVKLSFQKQFTKFTNYSEDHLSLDDTIQRPTQFSPPDDSETVEIPNF
jgi:replicative DNA helicase